jgi:UDP-glucuronate 4-epimerase
MAKTTILVTGAAGFIGYHLSKKLLELGIDVVGIDNINDYYDTALKYGRLNDLGIEAGTPKSSKHQGFSFYKSDISNKPALEEIFRNSSFDYIIHLAAQAGVRYSIENPDVYIQSNVQGFMNILEMARHYMPKHLIFASSSSVYGLNGQMPFSTSHHTDHPVSLYAATKKANEMMAHCYAQLYNIPCTGLRFFTVYGPWGRPDMAYFGFTQKIYNGQPIQVFNNGDLMRDFTYIDDIVDGIVRLIDKVPQPNEAFDNKNPDPSTSSAPYAIYNIGNNKPVQLKDFIETLEGALGKEAVKEYKPMQQGDVYATFADVSALNKVCGFEPKTNIKEGLGKFAEWYKEFYQQA